jgi:hypothetical protein
MPIRVTKDASGTFVCLDYGGALPTLQETLAALGQAIADPAFRSEVCILIDGRGISEPPSTDRVKTMREKFGLLQALPPGRRIRIAVVYERNAKATFGMLRMAQMLGDGPTMRLQAFETIEDAQSWLRS